MWVMVEKFESWFLHNKQKVFGFQSPIWFWGLLLLKISVQCLSICLWQSYQVWAFFTFLADLAYCAPGGASIGGGGGGGTEDFSANSTPNNRDFKNTVGWTFDVGGNLISQPFSPLKMHKMSQFFSQCLLMPSSGSWKPFLNQGKLLQLAPTQIYYVFISVCIIILVYFCYASSFEWYELNNYDDMG